MDAALDETFLPRGAQGSLKVGGGEKQGVRKGEGVKRPIGGGGSGPSLSRVGFDPRWGVGSGGSFLLI